MSTDSLVNLLVVLLALAGIVAVALGFAYWAYRARHDRSAFVGLYLLFGFPAALFLVAGLAVLVAGDERLATLLLLLALGFGLPLLPPFRRLMAALTPMDAASPVDMAGLCVLLPILAAIGYTSSGTLGPPETVPAVGWLELGVQTLFLVVIAYVVVGWRVVRSFPAATARLGIVRPTWAALGAALAALLAAFIFQAVVTAVGLAVQPGISEELDRVTDQLTGNLQNPLGAAAIGIGAGVGEEALVRGALQPRYGIMLTSILFALLHAPQYGFNFAVVGLFGVSLLLGFLRIRFGTTAAMIMHALYNFVGVMLATYA